MPAKRACYKWCKLIHDIRRNPFTIIFNQYDDLGLIDYTRRLLEWWADELIFTKAGDWKGGCEFRIMAYCPHSKDQLVDFGDSMAGIMFGANCAEEDIIQTVASCGEHTQFEQLKRENWAPWYSFLKDLSRPSTGVKRGQWTDKPRRKKPYISAV